MIGGIWENKYVQYLGVLEHLEECQVLHNTWLVDKSSFGNQESCVSHSFRQFEEELCDLYLILQKKFSDDNPVVLERLRRFEDKQHEEYNYGN